MLSVCSDAGLRSPLYPSRDAGMVRPPPVAQICPSIRWLACENEPLESHPWCVSAPDPFEGKNRTVGRPEIARSAHVTIQPIDPKKDLPGGIGAGGRSGREVARREVVESAPRC